MKMPDPTDTHVVVRASAKHVFASEGKILWDGPIKPGVPLVDYVPAAAFRLNSDKFATIAYEPDPHKPAPEDPLAEALALIRDKGTYSPVTLSGDQAKAVEKVLAKAIKKRDRKAQQ